MIIGRLVIGSALEPRLRQIHLQARWNKSRFVGRDITHPKSPAKQASAREPVREAVAQKRNNSPLH
jgi:hypothetical protein